MNTSQLNNLSLEEIYTHDVFGALSRERVMALIDEAVAEAKEWGRANGYTEGYADSYDFTMKSVAEDMANNNEWLQSLLANLKSVSHADMVNAIRYVMASLDYYVQRAKAL